jgi:hypothetical protein
MSTDHPPTNCTAYQDELLRLTCGDIAEPSDSLRAHLEACPACRESAVAARELIRSLEAALAPEPLSDELVARIHARFDTAAAPTRMVWTMKFRVACTVAAAAAVTALLVPWGLRTHSPATTGTEIAEIKLSAEDATTIVAAFTRLDWDSPEYSVEALQEKIEDITQTVERDKGAQTLLPWGRDDDWDVPVNDTGRTELRSPSICAVPERSGGVGPAT